MKDIKYAVYGPCIQGSKSREELVELCQEKASVISQYLNEKQYLVGDNICYVDFQVFEVLTVISLITN